MNEVPQKISLDELRPGETFEMSGLLSDDFALGDFLRYIRASPDERRAIEIATLGYPLTEKAILTDKA